MTNLLEETREFLDVFNLSPLEVVWIGSKNGRYAITWDEFEAIANVEYDNGFGAPKIAQDLVIVGRDWWLERHEYDGAESWELKSRPALAANHKSFTKVVGSGWRDLFALNTPEEDVPWNQ